MAQPSVICYADPNKKRTGYILSQFAQGCSGAVVYDGVYRGGPSAFFGVQPHNLDAWHEAQKSDDPYYYIDNGYFSGLFKGHEYYKVTKNGLQYQGKFNPDYKRLEAQGVHVEDWKEGHFILFCPPREFWMQNTMGLDHLEWRRSTLKELRAHTDMDIVERLKPNNIHEYKAKTPEIALYGCHAVVTFMSNIAVEALMKGVNVFVSQAHCAACISNTVEFALSRIENPYRAEFEERKVWAATLANNQWTLAEIASGRAWRAINDCG